MLQYSHAIVLPVVSSVFYCKLAASTNLVCNCFLGIRTEVRVLGKFERIGQNDFLSAFPVTNNFISVQWNLIDM